jgi:hypothetical protein
VQRRRVWPRGIGEGRTLSKAISPRARLGRGNACGCAGAAMRGLYGENSAMRPAAPAAAEISLHTSDSARARRAEHRVEHELRAVRRRSSLASTSCAPSHSTPTTLTRRRGKSRRRQDRARPRRRAGGAHRRPPPRRRSGRWSPLRAERLHDPHGAEIFGREGGRFGQRVLRPPRAGAHRAPRGDQRQHDERDRDQHQAGELRAGETIIRWRRRT